MMNIFLRGGSSEMKALPSRDLLSIAPMMDVTDRHFRFMFRMISKRTKLYTEMIVDETLIHANDDERFLSFDPIEHPIAIQFGGSNPEYLAQVTPKAVTFGYDEINLNVGCPSKKVSGHLFGARLMLTPTLVRDCMTAIRKSVTTIPATVKCRLGVDDQDSYESLHTFVQEVSESGVTHFIVHARKCLLKGLSTHQNRTIPPLKYDWVFRLIADFPDLNFSLNGGVKTLEEVENLLNSDLHDSLQLNSVMIGRAAWHNPFMFCDADRRIFRDVNPGFSRFEILEKYLNYATSIQEAGGRFGAYFCTGVSHFVRPILGLFYGTPGACKWRKEIHNQTIELKNSNLRDVVKKALVHIHEEVLHEKPPIL